MSGVINTAYICPRHCGWWADKMCILLDWNIMFFTSSLPGYSHVASGKPLPGGIKSNFSLDAATTPLPVEIQRIQKNDTLYIPDYNWVRVEWRKVELWFHRMEWQKSPAFTTSVSFLLQQTSNLSCFIVFYVTVTMSDGVEACWVGV